VSCCTGMELTAPRHSETCIVGKHERWLAAEQAELDRLRAENERLKANVDLVTAKGNEFFKALSAKDAALDRLEWADLDETGYRKRCIACGWSKHQGGVHAPDCWHQAARKAGHE